MCGQNLPVRRGFGSFNPDVAKAEWRAKYGPDAQSQRDQSEDRQQPKFLVMYQEAHEDYRAGWWVVRAADLEKWDGPFSSSADVVRVALEREAKYA